MSSATPAPTPPAFGAELFASPAAALDDTGLAEGLRALGRLAARVEARRAELLAEADRRVSATPTTSPTGRTAAKQKLATCACSAEHTTGKPTNTGSTHGGCYLGPGTAAPGPAAL